MGGTCWTLSLVYKESAMTCLVPCRDHSINDCHLRYAVKLHFLFWPIWKRNTNSSKVLLMGYPIFESQAGLCCRIYVFQKQNWRPCRHFSTVSIIRSFCEWLLTLVIGNHSTLHALLSNELQVWQLLRTPPKYSVNIIIWLIPSERTRLRSRRGHVATSHSAISCWIRKSCLEDATDLLVLLIPSLTATTTCLLL